MGLPGSIALGVLALILIGAGVLFSFPVRLRFHATSKGVPRVSAYASVLGGLTPEIRLATGDRPEETEPKTPKDRKPGKFGSRRNWFRGLPRLVAEVLAKVRVERVSASGSFGFDDPADTGTVYGLLTPALYAVPPDGTVQVNMQPVFDHACLSGEVDAQVRFTPARVLPPVARYVLHSLRGAQ